MVDVVSGKNESHPFHVKCIASEYNVFRCICYSIYPDKSIWFKPRTDYKAYLQYIFVKSTILIGSLLSYSARMIMSSLFREYYRSKTEKLIQFKMLNAPFYSYGSFYQCNFSYLK